jgi:hypothetical protein
MSKLRKYRFRTRLSALALTGRGLTVHDALVNAERVFEALREPCLAEIDECLHEIQASFGPSALHRDDRDLEELYVLSSRIIDSSHCLPSSGVDRAAHALCALIDGCGQLGLKDWAAIDVHLRAVFLLRATGASLPEAAKSAILEGLTKVTRKRIGEAQQEEPEDAQPVLWSEDAVVASLV